MSISTFIFLIIYLVFDDTDKSTEQQNRTLESLACRKGYNDIHIVLNEIHIPNTSESAYQHLRPTFQSWDKNVGSIVQTPHPNTKRESGDKTISMLEVSVVVFFVRIR